MQPNFRTCPPKRRGPKRPRHNPAIGSRLPSKIKEELEEQEDDGDDRKFAKKFVNKVATRKEQRKQKRIDKGKRKLANYLDHHPEFQKRQKQDDQQPKDRHRSQQKKNNSNNNNGKQNATGKTGTPENKKENSKKEPVKKVEATSKKDEAAALQRLSKRNPRLYAALESDNLLGNTTNSAFADDDRDIAYWEKKLGVKSGGKNVNKELEADGLLDLLDGLGGGAALKEDGEDDTMDDQEYLRQKRNARKAESNVDAMFDGLDGEDDSEEDDDDEEEDDEDLDDDEDMLESEEDSGDLETADEDEEENENEDSEDEEGEEAVWGGLQSDEDVPMNSASEDGSENDSEEDASEISEMDKDEPAPKNPEEEAPKATSKYVPPHLRKAPTTKTEQQIRLQRQLQGLLNRLSESNMDGILLDIENCYSNYPRHDVTSTVTDLILSSISQKANLLDSFVVVYAAIVGGLYRLVGIDFAAHFVQTLVESFEKDYHKCRAAVARGDEEGEEGIPGAKESKNLLTLALELYNFQVISCILIYDIVRVLIKQLDEHSVELLLKVVKTAGFQLRADDPASLKDMIDEIQKETAKRDASTISTRHKFMLETLANVRNNKVKAGQATSAADKELVFKMKKFLNGLDKKRSTKSAEALRVSLDDIHNIETKGKWWLVGASWRDNLVGTESKHSKKVAKDLRKEQTLQESLLKLAKKQGMNTDIRRSIFVALMSADDYVDAFEKLMKLGLTEVQQREIARVLLQCSGNEKAFNPYYMVVAKRLCESNHSFKVTFQYCLWDFLRECGEREVGGMERSVSTAEDGSNVRISRVSNLAKFYGSLIANESLSLAILRSVNFMTVTTKTRLFLQILFSTIFLQIKAAGPTAIASVFGKINELRTLAQGCVFFMQEALVESKVPGLSPPEVETVLSGIKIAREVLRK